MGSKIEKNVIAPRLEVRGFQVDIDYNKSIVQLIQECDRVNKDSKFEFVADEIKKDNMLDVQFKRRILHDNIAVEEIVNFMPRDSCNMSCKQILINMSRRGYRPATIRETLSLFIDYPKIQRIFFGFALGSTFHGPKGNLFHPFIAHNKIMLSPDSGLASCENWFPAIRK